MFTIEIPFPPTSWAPSRITKFGNYNPKAAEKRAVRHLIATEFNGLPLDTYTVIELLFRFKIPVSASKKKRAQMLAGDIIPTRSDCTNMQKLYEDCLKKIVIDDDRKVAKISSEKIYAEKEGVVINIYTLQEYRDAHSH